ncbi:MAG: hypothetical protein V2A73_02315 [Pseudomonadota bacterium]
MDLPRNADELWGHLLWIKKSLPPGKRLHKEYIGFLVALFECGGKATRKQLANATGKQPDTVGSAMHHCRDALEQRKSTPRSSKLRAIQQELGYGLHVGQYAPASTGEQELFLQYWLRGKKGKRGKGAGYCLYYYDPSALNPEYRLLTPELPQGSDHRRLDQPTANPLFFGAP